MSSTEIAFVPTTNEDLDIVLAIEQSPDNSLYIGQWEREQHQLAIADPNIGYFNVIAENKIVGYVILIGLTNSDRSIQFKRIAIQQKGYGFGRQAIRLVKRITFEQFKAHRLWLDVMVHNTRAYSLYLSEGFVEEGILRQSLRQGENFIDLKVMSILESEYKQV